MFLHTGYISWIWKQSLIIPLLKPKSLKTNLASYRPISLTCSLSKILKKCILELLIKQIENKISIKKFGFKTNGSTFQNLLYNYKHIFKELDATENIDLILFALSRAFDKVDYKILFDKIQSFDIPSSLFNNLREFLQYRYHSVQIEDHTSCPL